MIAIIKLFLKWMDNYADEQVNGKKEKTSQINKNTLPKSIDNEIFNSEQFQLEALSFAHWKLNENKGDYVKVKKCLSEIKLSENQKDIIIEKLKLINSKDNFQAMVENLQNLINCNEKEKAFDLAFDAYKRNKENVQYLELLIQVYRTYNDDNKVLELFDELMEINPSEKLNIEYRKGLVLKLMKKFDESKQVFIKLNSQREYAWDFYQIAIIENLLGNTKSCLDYLEKTFKIDESLKQDAINFSELSNLKENSEFINLIK